MFNHFTNLHCCLSTFRSNPNLVCNRDAFPVLAFKLPRMWNAKIFLPSSASKIFHDCFSIIKLIGRVKIGKLSRQLAIKRKTCFIIEKVYLARQRIHSNVKCGYRASQTTCNCDKKIIIEKQLCLVISRQKRVCVHKS